MVAHEEAQSCTVKGGDYDEDRKGNYSVTEKPVSVCRSLCKFHSCHIKDAQCLDNLHPKAVLQLSVGFSGWNTLIVQVAV
jgi:hypothetical protein